MDSGYIRKHRWLRLFKFLEYEPLGWSRSRARAKNAPDMVKNISRENENFGVGYIFSYNVNMHSGLHWGQSGGLPRCPRCKSDLLNFRHSLRKITTI